jgi:hypothetical protein
MMGQILKFSVQVETSCFCAHFLFINSSETILYNHENSIICMKISNCIIGVTPLNNTVYKIAYFYIFIRTTNWLRRERKTIESSRKISTSEGLKSHINYAKLVGSWTITYITHIKGTIRLCLFIVKDKEVNLASLIESHWTRIDEEHYFGLLQIYHVWHKVKIRIMANIN